jgi:hypothetical protein
LVAAKTHDGLALLEHSRGAVASVSEGFRCVGSGGPLGTYIADQFLPPGASLMSTCIVAVHMLQRVKKYDLYCGFDSDVRYLTPAGERKRVVADDIEGLEHYFDLLYANIRPLLFMGPDPQVGGDIIEMQANALGRSLKVGRPQFNVAERHQKVGDSYVVIGGKRVPTTPELLEQSDDVLDAPET